MTLNYRLPLECSRRSAGANNIQTCHTFRKPTTKRVKTVINKNMQKLKIQPENVYKNAFKVGRIIVFITVNANCSSSPWNIQKMFKKTNFRIFFSRKVKLHNDSFNIDL